VKSDYLRGVTLAVIAAVCWGTMSPVAKLLTAGGVILMTAMVVRALFVAVVMGPWVLLKRRKALAETPRSTYTFYFISGMLSVVCSGAGFLMSLETLSVAEALIIHYTFPLITLAGSLWVTREKPTKAEVFAGFLILLGVYFGMAGGNKSFSGVPMNGLLWGILAIAGISGQSLYVRRFSKKQQNDPLMLLFFAHFFGLFVLLIIKSVFMGWDDLANLNGYMALLLGIQSLLGSLLAYGFFYSALKYIPAATVSLICTLEMVVAVFLTAVCVGLMPTLQEIFGCAVILAAVLIASVRRKG
jgi:drug/metabolite transporter (DMT)-like permease